MRGSSLGWRPFARTPRRPIPPEAPQATSFASTSTTWRPQRASSRATEQPTMPPPTTRYSTLSTATSLPRSSRSWGPAGGSTRTSDRRGLDSLQRARLHGSDLPAGSTRDQLGRTGPSLRSCCLRLTVGLNRADQGYLSATFEDGYLKLSSDCTYVLVEDIDRHVPGPLDGRHPGLGDANELGELALGEAGLLAQRRKTCGQSELVFDLGDPLLSHCGSEDLLLPITCTHRLSFPFFDLDLARLDPACLFVIRSWCSSNRLSATGMLNEPSSRSCPHRRGRSPYGPDQEQTESGFRSFPLSLDAAPSCSGDGFSRWCRRAGGRVLGQRRQGLESQQATLRHPPPRVGSPRPQRLGGTRLPSRVRPWR